MLCLGLDKALRESEVLSKYEGRTYAVVQEYGPKYQSLMNKASYLDRFFDIYHAA
jgi:hypothetical protein